MADIIGKTPRFVTLKIRIPTDKYDLFAYSYPCEVLALAALRAALPSLLEVLIERRTAEHEHAANVARARAVEHAAR